MRRFLTSSASGLLLAVGCLVAGGGLAYLAGLLHWWLAAASVQVTILGWLIVYAVMISANRISTGEVKQEAGTKTRK